MKTRTNMGRRFENKVTIAGSVTTNGDVEQPLQWSSSTKYNKDTLVVMVQQLMLKSQYKNAHVGGSLGVTNIIGKV